jgi:hypothetical protein
VRGFERAQAVEVVEHLVVESHRPVEAFAAVHDAVRGSPQFQRVKAARQPADDELQRLGMVQGLVGGPAGRGQRPALAVAGLETGLVEQALHLAGALRGRPGPSW